MRDLWGRLLADRHGATAIEYGLITAFLVLALTTTLAPVRDAMNGALDNIAYGQPAGDTQLLH